MLTHIQENGVEPNEVTYTALIKGQAADGDMRSVRKTLAEMAKYVFFANIEHYNMCHT